MTYGVSFFEGYQSLDGIYFSRGFSLGANGTAGTATLESTLPLACASLSANSFAYFEVGNEADQYASTKSNRGPIRDYSWSVSNWYSDWQNRTDILQSIWSKSECSHLPVRFIAPSFAGTSWILPAVEGGIDREDTVPIVSVHNYIASANSANVTLQGTLMNHTITKDSVDKHAAVMASISPYTDIPYMLGEANILSSQGKPGSSNAFGAALWSIDFSLYSASVGIYRIHYHNGVNYNHASWQPANYNLTVPVTKPPYCGNIATAATLGFVKDIDTRVSSIPLEEDTKAAYAIYQNGTLAKIAIINMESYNYTGQLADRPKKRYSFSLGSGTNYEGYIQHLVANGSDAVTGILWDGYSYNYDLANGKPVRFSNVTHSEEETVSVIDGVIDISLPYSSYALLNFT